MKFWLLQLLAKHVPGRISRDLLSPMHESQKAVRRVPIAGIEISTFSALSGPSSERVSRQRGMLQSLDS